MLDLQANLIDVQGVQHLANVLVTNTVRAFTIDLSMKNVL